MSTPFEDLANNNDFIEVTSLADSEKRRVMTWNLLFYDL